MPDATFLETYPLYKRYKMKIPEALHFDLPKPPIIMKCTSVKCNDGRTRTFKMENEYYVYPVQIGGKGSITKHKVHSLGVDTYHANFDIEEKNPFRAEEIFSSKGAIVKAEYQCTSCHEYKRTFILRFSPELDYVQKVGQFPPWDVSISGELRNNLGEYTDLYKKGVTCESQSYGIGAFSYYRRIIEEIIEELLISIEDIIDDDEKRVEYEVALEKIKMTNITEEKIALVKDILPDSLRPDGINPLAELHSILSEGLHGKSDEECLEDSEAIRNVLEFLTLKISQSKDADKKFKAGMKKILDKKSKK